MSVLAYSQQKSLVANFLFYNFYPKQTTNMNNQTQITHKYKCSQLLGYKGRSQKLIDQDNLTSLKFDPTGRYLALGDKSGRLIVFQTSTGKAEQQKYQYYYEFQSHLSGFDTLKHHNVLEELTFIQWFRPQGRYHKLLTANSHTIKFWRVSQKSQQNESSANRDDLVNSQFQEQEPTFRIRTDQNYENQSYNPLNTVQLSFNQEYIFTADEKAVYLWNTQDHRRAFLQKELKNGNQNKLQKSQKISCANINKERESLQVYGKSKGQLSLIDSRTSINDPTVLDFKCFKNTKILLYQLINQYTSIRFLDETSKIATRDLISVKIWDMRNNREPFLNVNVDQTIQKRICDLFQNQVLGDKFKLTNANKMILTGNYGDSFQIIDPITGQNVQYELDYGQKTRARTIGGGSQRLNQFSCDSKVQSHDFNQRTGQLAVSTHSCFFIFSQVNQE